MQSSRTKISPSDSLMSYPGQSFLGVLLLKRNAVGLFYNRSQMVQCFMCVTSVLFQKCFEALVVVENSYFPFIFIFLLYSQNSNLCIIDQNMLNRYKNTQIYFLIKIYHLGDYLRALFCFFNWEYVITINITLLSCFSHKC